MFEIQLFESFPLTTITGRDRYEQITVSGDNWLYSYSYVNINGESYQKSGISKSELMNELSRVIRNTQGYHQLVNTIR